MSEIGQRVYQAALAWHEAGASVMPCTTNGGKRPLLDWKQLKGTRLSRPALTGYLSAGAREGFGILPGYGGFEMFEVEGRAVLDGTVTEFLQLMRDNAPELLKKLSSGYVESTPSSGVHWIYRMDGAPARNKPLAHDADGKVTIETRGEGGFTVLAPSGGVTHTTIPGGQWTTKRTPADVVTITEEEREKLYAVAQMCSKAPVKVAGPGPSGEKRELVARGEGSPVDDYNANGDWSILEEYGWTKTSEDPATGKTYWLRPGKTDFSENPHSASTDAATPNLYIWSTSVPGLAAEVPHSRAYVRAHYKHGGNMGACREELAGRGYGRASTPQDDWAAADKIAWAAERAIVTEQAKKALANVFATPEQIEAAEAVLEAAAVAVEGQRFYRISELEDIEPPTPLIERILDVSCTAVLSGMNQTYKTFVAIAWAASLACGRDWCAHRVPKPARVLYVAAEGAAGIFLRLRAWQKGNVEIPDDMFFVFPRPVKVMDAEALHEIEQFVHDNEVEFVVLDTMRKMTPGIEENSSTEMGAALAAVDGIKERQACTILWVHHTGHMGSRTRGSSAIEDDVDISWICELEDGDDRNVSNRRILKQRKIKDGEAADDRALILKVETIETKRGTKTSCYVDLAEDPFERSNPGAKGTKRPPVDPILLRNMIKVITSEPNVGTSQLQGAATSVHFQLAEYSQPLRNQHLAHLQRAGIVKARSVGNKKVWTVVGHTEISDPDLLRIREALVSGQDLSVEQLAKFSGDQPILGN